MVHFYMLLKALVSDGKPGHVLVIGATNRLDAVDPALRRPRRFDEEIFLGFPDENARVHILSMLTKNVELEGSIDLVKLSRATPGFVGARASSRAMKSVIKGKKLELIKEGTDTEDLWRKAWTAEEMEKLSITMSDFEEAAKLVQPSSKREGFPGIPNVKWEDVGGRGSLREVFECKIVLPLKYRDEFEENGLALKDGFLLYGPPGCGKTLIAKAIANGAGANFIHIKGPEFLEKYVCESVSAVPTLCSLARACSPCILFFDEVDAMTGGLVVDPLLRQLLMELEEDDQLKGVYIIGATNRPEVMDPALLRPRRFGKRVYVPLPTEDERALILKALSKEKPLDDNVDLDAIARREACAGLSGADLKALINEAAKAAAREGTSVSSSSAAREGTSVSSGDQGSMQHTIKAIHFEQAFGKISPSVSDEEIQRYESFK